MDYRAGALIAALSFSFVLPAHAADKQPAAAPLARVNGVAIPASLADMLVKDQAQASQEESPDSAQLRERVREHLVRIEVLQQAARKAGTDKLPEVRQRIGFASSELLANAYLSRWVEANPISEQAARAEYERLLKESAAPREYLSRHILVETEQDALDAIAKLKEGKAFADLASEVSKDPGSKDSGGELGWTRTGAFVPEFDAALTKLEKGQYTTEPVKTDFGYHIILLEDTRAVQPPQFELVKERLMESMKQQAVQKHIESLVSKAKIE
ncbi:peptidylprolyl isomerase [Methyloversatilis thermotolerans]|uniref:peptidylprolyl isomerase n=1 Tax=Methyloversatilis thermotolerans TaxID=1346290 RepID=UPI0003A68B1F|nr:peptidylprolyl isomerase [Methyloversatilis thermotolerans]